MTTTDSQLDGMEANGRCPIDGQTLAWHQRAEAGPDGNPRTNGQFIGCAFGSLVAVIEPAADVRLVTLDELSAMREQVYRPIETDD